MTPQYAAKRLLEHGALTRGEFKNITGWHQSLVSKVLSQLIQSRIAFIRQVEGLNVYQLH